MSEMLTSHDPATGEEIWSGAIGDAAAEVAAARAAWPAWAAHSLSFRIETLRRFANVVRAKEEEFARLISSETGKPLWEAKTEVGAVIKPLLPMNAANWIRRMRARNLKKAPPLPPELRRELTTRIFRDEIERTARLIGRSLDHWL